MPISPVKLMFSCSINAEPAPLVADWVVMFTLKFMSGALSFSQKTLGIGNPLTTQNNVAEVLTTVLTVIDDARTLGGTV